MGEKIEIKGIFAKYTVRVPVEFTFQATANLDNDVLYKMAESYAQLIFDHAAVDYNEEDVEIVKKQTLYTKEQMEEMRKERERQVQEVGF